MLPCKGQIMWSTSGWPSEPFYRPYPVPHPRNRAYAPGQAKRQEHLLQEDEQAQPQAAPVVGEYQVCATLPPLRRAPRGACFLCRCQGHFKRDCPYHNQAPWFQLSASQPRSFALTLQLAAWFTQMFQAWVHPLPSLPPAALPWPPDAGTACSTHPSCRSHGPAS